MEVNGENARRRIYASPSEHGGDFGDEINNDDHGLLGPKSTTSDGLKSSISLSRTGGVYIPPFKLARLQREVDADDSVEYQRQEWDRLKKRINSVVNKLTATNVPEIIGELLECNVIRGRGLLARTWIRAQMASPGFTPIYASFLAVVNSKFPEVGELVLRRVLLQFRRAYKRNDRLVCQSCVKCIAHLVNQRIAHEIMALQLLAILLESPTDDSVEVAVEFLSDVGAFLQESCKQGMEAIFDRLNVILQSGEVEKKTQYSIEKLWDLRRQKFGNVPPVPQELDLVEQDDQITHDIDFLDESITSDEILNVFRPADPKVFREENKRWQQIRDTLLGVGPDEGPKDSESDSSTDSELYAQEGDSEEGEKGTLVIRDSTEQDLINLRKTVYLCIMSSLNYEECVHKLLKLNIQEGHEVEVCTMLIDCCAMERTFQRFYALQAERLAKLRLQYSQCLQECFAKQYKLVHRLETAKLRNTARFFAHLLLSDAIPWSVLGIIQLSEEATTSSGRIFIKIIFQELCHQMGIKQLDQKLHDPEVLPHLTGIFPKDNPKHIRFSINFFTAIGLGVLTERLRLLLR